MSKPALPAKGGSYVRDDKGKLIPADAAKPADKPDTPKSGPKRPSKKEA